jgi:Ca2+-binding RTX toxin-like protein
VSQEVIVNIKGDTLAVGNEGFNVKLTGASDAVVDPTYELTGITIGDDDGARCPGHARLPGAHVVGTPRPDKLKGTAGPNVLCGLGGDDRMNGRGGRDVLFGGADDDTISARDGTRDIVNCGPGRKDEATVDRRDKVKGCEKVKRPRK